jgi:hypothetical protein
MTPDEIGKFTHESIGPLLQRAQKKIESAGIKTQLKLPHGDNVRQGSNIYAVDIGQVLYAIPSENMIKVEVVPESNTVVVSTTDNLLGQSIPLADGVADALMQAVELATDRLIDAENGDQSYAG